MKRSFLCLLIVVLGCDGFRSFPRRRKHISGDHTRDVWELGGRVGAMRMAMKDATTGNFIILHGMFRVWRSAICIFLGSTLLLTPRLDAKESRPEDVGLVLRIKGEWLLNGNAVVAGETLPARGKIFHSSKKGGESSSFDNITVVIFNGKLESRSWDKTETWNDPIQLPAATKEVPSPWERIVAAVKGVFPGHPEKYTQMSVRGSAADLRDAVVELKDWQVNLAPAFKHMQKGTYLLLFQPTKGTTASHEQATLKPALFNWDPSAPSPLRVDGLRPSLYDLSLLSVQSEDHQFTGAKAWILVADNVRYEKTAAAFQQGVALTEHWGKEAPADAARSFLRAYLDSLALQEAD
jgi:hypothetical protein